MSDSKRKFFAGNSMEQAVMMAARHYGLEPDELNYKEVQKRHGFVNARRRFVISVDADVPRAPRDQIEAEALLREKERQAAEAAKGRRRGGGNQRGRQGAQKRQMGPSGAARGSKTGGDRRPKRNDDRGTRSKAGSSGSGRGSARNEGRRHPAKGRAATTKGQGSQPARKQREERKPRSDSFRGDEGKMPDPPAPKPVVAPEAGETGWWFARPVRGDAGPAEDSGRDSRRGSRQEGRRSNSHDSEAKSQNEPVRRERSEGGEERGRKPTKSRGRRRPASKERREEEVQRRPATGPMAEAAEEAIELLLDFAELDVDPEIFETPKRLEIDLAGPDDDVVTSDNGKVLLALEHLMPRVLRGIHGETTAVRVDCAGYHRRREERLEAMAIAAADRVIDSGRPQTLEEMDPAERRIVHMAVADEEGVETISVGDGFFKRVKIRPA